MKIRSSCYSLLLTSTRLLALLVFSFLALQLHAGAPPKPTPLKTPAEASVTFELTDIHHNLPLCSGARFSHGEIATSQSCLEKLKTHIDAGSPVHAISSHGEDYGEILLPDTSMEGEATAGTEAPLLAIVTLTAPTAINVLWPSIHIDETPSNSMVTVHRTGEDRRGQEEDNLHKRSVTSQAIPSSCEGELCTVHTDDGTMHLNDGESVFQDDHLLCIGTEEGRCLRTRSLVARQSGCPGLQHVKCDNLQGGTCTAGISRIVATCMHKAITCEVTIIPKQELVVCDSCTVTYSAGQVIYTSGEVTSDSPINDDCPEISSSGTPWYRTIEAIAGFSVGGLVLVCVAPCVACTLCICCGCFACCEGCAMCAKSRTTVNTKVQLQPMQMQPMQMQQP